VTNQQWNTRLYNSNHDFVWKLAAPLVELLNPQPGEAIVDLGCGTGQLTAEIARSGARVIGVDESAEMVESAQAEYPELTFLHADARDFEISTPCDAIFSNACLHWVPEAGKVVRRVSETLRPGGRFVAEFGGAGNVRRLVQAIEAAFQVVAGIPRPHRWYFPTIGEYATLLEQHQLEPVQMVLFDRPVPLSGNDAVRDWVKMFGQYWIQDVPQTRQQEFLDEVVRLAPRAGDHEQEWIADYRRIRVTAVRVPH